MARRLHVPLHQNKTFCKEKTMTAEAKEIWEQFSSRRITAEEAKNRLLELTFRRKYEFALGSMDEDEFSEFLIYLEARLPSVLQKYNPLLSDFSTYLYGVVSVSSCWWKKKLYEKKERMMCCETLTIEETFSDEEAEDEAYARPESSLSLKELSIMARKNLSYCASRRSGRTRKSRNEEELAKSICLVLAVKSCFSITDSLIEKVSAATGYGEEQLRLIILEARESIEKKESRLKCLSAKRNSAYFQRKKFFLHREEWKNVYSAEPGEDAASSSYLTHDNRWKKTLLELSRSAQMLVPSNITVGRLLSMTPRHVAFLISKAKKRISGAEEELNG